MRFFCFHLMPWAHLPVEQGGYVIVGSSETVRQRQQEYARRVGFGVLVANCSVGNVPSALTSRGMPLFAQEVMPKLRRVNADAPPSLTPTTQPALAH
jgi:hypothetical protein